MYSLLKKMLLLITFNIIFTFFSCASTPATPNKNEIELLAEIQREGGAVSKRYAANLIRTLKSYEAKGMRLEGFNWLMRYWSVYPYEVYKLRQAFYPEQAKTELDDEIKMLAEIITENGARSKNIAVKFLLVTKKLIRVRGKKVGYDYLMKYGTTYPYEIIKIRDTLFPEHASVRKKTESKQKPSSKKKQKKPSATSHASTSKPYSKPAPTPQIVTWESPAKQEHPSKKFRKKYALIIGISEYKYSGKHGLTNLLYADDDAFDFVDTLKNMGWRSSHIKILTNHKATKRNIEIALESWFTKAGSRDLIIVFWSGHGYPDPEDPEKVYFACYDSEINIPATGYRMDRVRLSLEERRTKNVLFFADTCHAGKLITRGERGISVVPHINKLRREKKIPKGWVFMVGAETDRQALEHSSWSNGAFTHCLLNGLRGKADGFESIGPKDGIVTMRELQTYMNTVMPDETHRVFGVARRPLITTTTGDPTIWDLSLEN